MKFLADENIPQALVKALEALGHDIVRADSSASDTAIASRAAQEERIVITLDKDFITISKAFPKKLDIVLIRIHPPYAGALVAAFEKLLSLSPPVSFNGLILLSESGHIRSS